MKPFHLPKLALALLLTATLASPVLAWPGDGWGGPGGYGGNGADGPGWNRRGNGSRDGRDPREGQVSVDRFVAPDALPAIAQAHNAVTGAPGGNGDARDDATFQAAVVDQLAKAGYDTINPDPHGGLVTEVHEGRDVVVPEEARHSPVSGEMEADVSNRGSGVSVAVGIDLTKPRKALIDTRLEVRIVDRVSGKALWEGRADIITREGDSHWTDTAVAARLAGALFEHYRGPKA